MVHHINRSEKNEQDRDVLAQSIAETLKTVHQELTSTCIFALNQIIRLSSDIKEEKSLNQLSQLLKSVSKSIDGGDTWNPFTAYDSPMHQFLALLQPNVDRILSEESIKNQLCDFIHFRVLIATSLHAALLYAKDALSSLNTPPAVNKTEHDPEPTPSESKPQEETRVNEDYQDLQKKYEALQADFAALVQQEQAVAKDLPPLPPSMDKVQKVDEALQTDPPPMNLDCLNENLLDKKADKEASRCRGGCVLM